MNSSTCFGITGIVSSSPDRSAPGSSTPSAVSAPSGSTSADCVLHTRLGRPAQIEVLNFEPFPWLVS